MCLSNAHKTQSCSSVLIFAEILKVNKRSNQVDGAAAKSSRERVQVTTLKISERAVVR